MKQLRPLHLISLLLAGSLSCKHSQSLPTDTTIASAEGYPAEPSPSQNFDASAWRKLSAAECRSIRGAEYYGNKLCILQPAHTEEIIRSLFKFIESDISPLSPSECKKYGGRILVDTCVVDLGTAAEIRQKYLSESRSATALGLAGRESAPSPGELERRKHALQCLGKAIVAQFASWAQCLREGNTDFQCGRICIPDGNGGVFHCPCPTGTPVYGYDINTGHRTISVPIEKQLLFKRTTATRAECRGSDDYVRLEWVEKDRGILLGGNCYMVIRE